MLKIKRLPSKSSLPCYGDLKPGDIFYFVNDPDKTPLLRINDTPVFCGGLLPRHVTLGGKWSAETSLPDSEVRLLDAELTVSEIR